MSDVPATGLRAQTHRMDKGNYIPSRRLNNHNLCNCIGFTREDVCDGLWCKTQGANTYIYIYATIPDRMGLCTGERALKELAVINSSSEFFECFSLFGLNSGS